MPYTILAAVMFLFVVTFMLVPFHFRLAYHRKEADDYIIIDTTALGKMIRYRLTIPIAELIKGKNFPWLQAEIQSRGGKTVSHIESEQAKGRAWLYFTWGHPQEVHGKIEKIIDLLHDYADFMRWVTEKVHFERLYWVTRVGFEDAAVTAIAVGTYWAVKSYIISALWHKHDHASFSPIVKVMPIYNQEIFHTDFECIFSVRLGHIIGAGIRLLRYKI